MNPKALDKQLMPRVFATTEIYQFNRLYCLTSRSTIATRVSCSQHPRLKDKLQYNKIPHLTHGIAASTAYRYQHECGV